MTRPDNKQNTTYGIGAVARMTGLTDHTIRVWERRYGAVIARRAANRRREYTPADVEKLRLLKRLTDQGIAISQIANLEAKELRQRAGDILDVASAGLSGPVRLAALGDLLPGRLSSAEVQLDPVEVRVADSNAARFAADLRQQTVDVVLLEVPVLDGSAVDRINALVSDANAHSGILLYGFARSVDVQAARDQGLQALRAPADLDQIRAAALRAGRQDGVLSADASTDVPADEMAVPDSSGPIPPRRFNTQQLANLANVNTSIDCECPRHLAQLVTDLSAFEIYSANCVNRGDEDEALHRYLHRTTAEARATIELALEHVAKIEKLVY